jgi:hypothetical protein
VRSPTRRAGRRIRLFLLAGFLAPSTAARAGAQSVPPSAGTLPVAAAELLRARADVTHASHELQRAEALHRRQLLSDAEMEARRLDFDHARAEYLRVALGVLSAGRHVVIERAVKRRLASGGMLVRLDVAPVFADSLIAPPSDVDGLDDVLHASELRNLVISLKAEAGPNGAVIAQPYEHVIPRARAGEHVRVEFELLEDLSDVVVAIGVGDRVEERRVRLGNDASVTGVSMRAAQFSLAGDLGSEIVYDLTLEPSGSRSPILRLDVEGLPDGVRYEFRDAASKTRVVQLRMPEGVVAQRLQLALTLPSQTTADVHADSVIRFAVVASADSDGAARSDAKGGAFARLPLEVVGRGVGRVELLPATLFVEAAPDAAVTVPVRLRNAGSRSLASIRVASEMPGQWPVTISPEITSALAPGETRTVQVSIRPPAGTPTGDYELRLSASSDERDRRVDVEDKVLRVRVAERGGLLGPGLLLAALGIVGVGLVAFGRRLVYR